MSLAYAGVFYVGKRLNQKPLPWGERMVDLCSKTKKLKPRINANER
jgi:hypothetical protein